MKAMMKRLGSMFLVFLLGLGVVLGTFQVSGNYFAGKTIAAEVKKAKGKYLGFDGTYIYVDMDSNIIKAKGDTEILAFITKGAQIIQLKSLKFPEAVAIEKFKDKSNLFIFYLLDVAHLVAPGEYQLQLYIKNSQYITDYVKLEDIPIVFEAVQQKEKLQ